MYIKKCDVSSLCQSFVRSYTLNDETLICSDYNSHGEIPANACLILYLVQWRLQSRSLLEYDTVIPKLMIFYNPKQNCFELLSNRLESTIIKIRRIPFRCCRLQSRFRAQNRSDFTIRKSTFIVRKVTFNFLQSFAFCFGQYEVLQYQSMRNGFKMVYAGYSLPKLFMFSSNPYPKLVRMPYSKNAPEMPNVRSTSMYVLMLANMIKYVHAAEIPEIVPRILFVDNAAVL